MDSEQTPINSGTERQGRLPAAIDDALLAFNDHVLWPLEDRFALLGDRARIAVGAGGALVVAAIVAGVVVLAGSGGSGTEPAAAQVAVASPPGYFGIPPAPSPPAPTLHGATPTFKAPLKKEKDSSEVDSAEAVESPSPTAAAATAGSPTAATEKISSQPSSSTATATTSAAAEAASVPGREAGAKAIAVARKFSDAFVVYETGGEESEVKPVFAATTTPELAKALLKRPPRLPANVKVPQAKVLNIVPGPSREGVYTLSVSLLRLGVTSELRLEMEQVKDDGWRVTNVLG